MTSSATRPSNRAAEAATAVSISPIWAISSVIFSEVAVSAERQKASSATCSGEAEDAAEAEEQGHSGALMYVCIQILPWMKHLQV